MATDLLTLRDREPPMGDLGEQSALAFTRALWTRPVDGEEDAPADRIIHARALQLHAPARLDRLGVRRAPGYHKCGSRQDLDWVVDLRIRAWADGWRVVRRDQDLPRPDPDTVCWIDLDGIETSALLVEVRRSGIDGWWTPWNLADRAFLLEGTPLGDPAPRDERLLTVERLDATGAPAGLDVSVAGGAVRYASDRLEVGFALRRTALTHLSIDGTRRGAFGPNLLHREPGTTPHGLLLHPVGGAPLAAPSLRYAVEGTVRVAGNRVTYDLRLGEEQRYRLAWTVEPDRLHLEAERTAERDLRAWTSSAWMMGLRSTRSAACLLGPLRRTGETGWVDPPAWLHAPGYGSLRIDCEGAAASGDSPEDESNEGPGDGATGLRANVYRPRDLITVGLKVGERPQPEGDYRLPSGRHAARVTLAVATPPLPSLHDDAPPAVRRALRRCALTALTYRPDTASLSNNGASIHVPLSMDSWAASALRLGRVLEKTDASVFLRTTLERWLDGAPGYASGTLRQDGATHAAEDEYLMTGTAGLLGLARYLDRAAAPEWAAARAPDIRAALDAAKARDLDGDGLVESPHRTGVSGTGQWGTSWMDVISFGWKDAFANALLYGALVRMARVLPRLEIDGRAGLSAEALRGWAARLAESYESAFLNPETGWVAGWRCREDRLHDHAFLLVNGAAAGVGLFDDDTARSALEALWTEAQRQGLPDPAQGLPVCLWPIPDADRAGIMQGYPFGYYQNGGCTHAQSRHLLRGLYRVGMTDEADWLLERLCAGLAEGRVYGGSKSGVDWRYWDGRPCGYEGLLTEQFGVVGAALGRYATDAGGDGAFSFDGRARPLTHRSS